MKIKRTNRVLFVVSNAAHIGPARRRTGNCFPEVAHAYEEFIWSGYRVDFATQAGGSPPMDAYDPMDAPSRAFRESAAFRRFQSSLKLDDVDLDLYDALFVPGGLGPMVDLAACPIVKRAIARAYDGGRVVGAVCHGPVAFLDVKLKSGQALLRGRRLTSFSNEEERSYAIRDVPFLLETEIRKQGGLHCATSPWRAHTVVDGRLVTGQNPASAAPAARTMIQIVEQERAA